MNGAEEYAYYETFLNGKLTERQSGRRFYVILNLMTCSYFKTDTPDKFAALSAEHGRQTGRNQMTPKKTRRSPQR